jgi:DNA-binding PadR family transcriptional regulator
MSRDSLTTTSYAVLGLLAVQPWSSYELTQQMDRSLGRIWPRAQSKLYEEPKKLVAAGLATARAEQRGRRRRTVYTITRAGRRALAAWLREPAAGPVIESEQLLKVFFADQGTTADLRRTLAEALRWAQERSAETAEVGRGYLAGEGPFPARLAVLDLSARFLADFYALVGEWAQWADGVVATWPEDPRQALADPAITHETVARAERTARQRDTGAHPVT